MNQSSFKELYLTRLAEAYSAEKQLIAFYEDLIENERVKNVTFKKVLEILQQEAALQLERLEKIYSILVEEKKETVSNAMEGLIKEANVSNLFSEQEIKESCLIAALQGILHYQISGYGTLKAYARHMETKAEVIDLFKENIEGKVESDKKLTKVAEGSFFSSGINIKASQK